MALAPGTRLGVYEITAPLGEGGMGQVWRARDTKLDRDVAIKVLPEAFAHDADRLARFTREARTLAALNHPNIAAIHGLEESSPSTSSGQVGVTALVMELVEGEDLSQRIARGAIPLDEAIPIAKQIAEALEAAHEQGIIHRDLKPANIKVRADGTVKVLDFGLAKALDPAAASSPASMNSPTITSPAMTQAGMILGTAAYMAPEQARGTAVDKRADVWAFGVVLFEMLTGQRLFAGATVSDTLAAVLKTEPDWTTLPAGTPTPLRRLLRRCLEKDRKRRLDSAAAARLEIDDALTPSPTADGASASGASASTASSRGRLPWMVATVAAAGMAALAFPHSATCAAATTRSTEMRWRSRRPLPTRRCSLRCRQTVAPSCSSHRAMGRHDYGCVRSTCRRRGPWQAPKVRAIRSGRRTVARSDFFQAPDCDASMSAGEHRWN